MQNHEQTLVSRALSGDRRGFDMLVHMHQSRLRYTLRQLTGWDEALADDLAQETFIRAYRGLSGYRSDARFFTWLYKIAYRVYLDHQTKRQPDIDWQAEYENVESLELEWSGDLHRDLAAALATLPPGQRAALHLLLHRECTHREISDILGMPLGTVKTNILRGRQQLEQLMANWK